MDFSDFVGLPWQDRGRGPGYDCWGLFRAAFEAGTAIDLPAHSDDYLSAADRTETRRLLAGDLGDWREVSIGREREFDGVVLAIAGGVHVGLVVRRGLMLHMPRGKTSVIEPLGRYGAVLTGIYRHRQLA